MADALSQKSGRSVAALITQQSCLLKEIEKMQMEVQVKEHMMTLSQLNQVIVNLICMKESNKYNRGMSEWSRLLKNYKEEKIRTFI